MSFNLLDAGKKIDMQCLKYRLKIHAAQQIEIEWKNLIVKSANFFIEDEIHLHSSIRSLVLFANKLHRGFFSF